LIYENISIHFDPLTYTVTVTPSNNTFYHIQLLGSYYESDKDDVKPMGQIFTNMDLPIGGHTLIEYFMENFWPER